jgi:hypothetical protein
MKKVFILLLAALLITCLLVSCDPDEETDTLNDELKGTWVCYPYFTDFKLEFDGYGNFSYEKKEEGNIVAQFSGTYSLDGSYIIFDVKQQSLYSPDHPMYVFLHNEADDVYLAMSDTDSNLPYAENHDKYYKCDVEESTYSFSREDGTWVHTFNTSSSSLNQKHTDTYKPEDTLLYKLETELDAEANYTENPAPNWYVKWYDESYFKYRITSQYPLADGYLTTYIDGGNSCKYHRY